MKHNLYPILCLLLLMSVNSPIQAQIESKGDSLRKVADQLSGVPKVKAILNLFYHYLPSDKAKAQHLLEEAENIADELPTEQGRALVLVMYGRRHQMNSQFDSLKAVAQKGIQLTKSMGFDSIQARFQGFMGTYYEKIGLIDSAIYHYQEVLALNVLAPYITNANLGLAYYQKGDVEQSIRYLTLAIEKAREKENYNAEAIVSNNLGNVFKDLGDKERAKQYFLRSMELKEKIGDERGKLFAISNLTTLKLTEEENDYYSAYGYDIALKLNDPYFITNFTPRKANIFNRKGHYEEALALLLPIYQDYTGAKTNIAYQEVLTSMIRSYVGQGDLLAAKKIALEKVEDIKGTGRLQSMQVAREKLLEIYRGLNDYQSYFELAPVYFAAQDSLWKATNIETLAAMESQLKDAEKEKEIVQLNSALQEKEARRNWIIAVASFLLIILSTIIYFRSRQVSTQRLLIEQEKKTGKELAHINEQLKSVDQMKSRFFTNISHELRTPVTLIVAPLANSLKQHQEEMGENAQKAMQIAHKNAAKLRALVEELLELSSIEAGKAKLNKTPTDINQYLKQLFIAFESGAAVKHITYHFDNELQSNTFLNVDKKRFSKIVNNLLSNALKFTPENGKVAMSAKITDEGMLKISVADTGRGIPKEDLPNIFDRYFQTSQKALAMEGGTGIGLALAKELAGIMDGQLSVKSEWGRGSTFVFETPAALVESSELEESGAPIAAIPAHLITKELSPGSRQQTKGRKILIVEDNPDMQALLQSLLAEAYECVVADNGAAAWSMLKGKDPKVEGVSLILSDVMMPQMDGYTLLEHIKKHEDWRQVPLIMLTARAAEEDKLHALRLGVDDYLAKPFSPEELLARVQNLITKYEDRQDFRKMGLELEFEPAISADQEWLKTLEEACRVAIDKKIDLTNSYLSDKLALGERQLLRRVRALTGLSVKQYVQEVRLQKARHLLEHRVYNTIAEVAYASGFNTPKYFSTLFEKHYGKRPVTYLE